MQPPRSNHDSQLYEATSGSVLNSLTARSLADKDIEPSSLLY
ncbi:hypothetical protein HanXRQr2_Chr13g0574231 [Helianthus annuus]|uniref:Uncharacterized protein n=1 Tax=Helianthus annuus TaxID=4232 RepID=A0A9K3EFK6_HELAN|nr:hypothetical protein HanXRQr2_Chr13g0574231 [Helianthus annuus]